MKHLIFLSAFFCLQGQAQTCEPDYQVIRQACKSTDQILKYDVVTKTKVRANTGACDPSSQDERDICNAHSKESVIAGHPGALPQDVRVTRSYSEVAGGKLCKITKNKRDVYCDFEFPAPVFAKVRCLLPC